MATVEKSVDVEVPLRAAYDQWTQFETFPHFMEGVERVDRLDEKRLRWVAEIGTAEREWDAEITDQVPDQLVAWRAVGQVRHAGQVRFEQLGEGRTRVNLELTYDPEGLTERADAALDVVDRRVAGDLERFKQLIEGRRVETGAWRARIS